MCPIYSRGGEIVASKCIVEPQLECPTIVYKSSDVFNCKLCFKRPTLDPSEIYKDTNDYSF